MNNTKKKIALFDFDGVLVNTLDVCYQISSEVNLDLSLEEYKTHFYGNIFESKRSNGLFRAFNPQGVQIYDSGTKEHTIPEVLKDAVHNLSGEYILCIVSSTSAHSIEKILERESVRDCFSDILGRETHTSKVFKIQNVLGKYQTDPKDAIFVTDTLGDIREGHECGVRGIGVTWGFHDTEVLEKGTPEKILDDPRDLEPTIRELLG